MTLHDSDEQNAKDGDANQPVEHRGPPSELKDIEFLDTIEFSEQPNKPPVHVSHGGTETAPDPAMANIRTIRATRRRKFRLRSSSAMGLIIVALGTVIGLVMRFLVPADQFGQLGLPPIKTPASQVDTPDLENVKP